MVVGIVCASFSLFFLFVCRLMCYWWYDMTASLAQVCLLVVWMFSFLLGVHAPNEQLCIAYTILFSMHLPWPEPAWCYSLFFALNWPTFAPKGRAKPSEDALVARIPFRRKRLLVAQSPDKHCLVAQSPDKQLRFINGTRCCC